MPEIKVTRRGKYREAVGARTSLTFRATADSAIQHPIHDNGKMFFEVCERVTDVTFAELMAELGPLLESDKTKRGGWEFDGKGRMSADLVTFSDRGFSYKYGGVEHKGKPMVPVVLKILAQVQSASGREFNWCHATYYPNGDSRLSMHADNEAVIKKGTDILCVSFFENPHDTRPLLLEGNKRRPVKRPRNVPETVEN